MAGAPIPKTKAAIRLARDIVQTMYDTGMRPGDRYLSEAEALKKHGVARATLREALRFLEIQGVLSVRAGPGGGPQVGKPNWPHLASTIALLLQFEGAPFQSVLEARSVLEPGMAELAATNATDQEIAAMAADLDRVEAHLAVYKLFRKSYTEFWNHLAQSTHNPLIAFLSPALRAIVDSAGFVPNELYRAEVLGRLRVLLTAVGSRNVEDARRAMTSIEAEFLRRLTTGYPRQMKRVVAWSDLNSESELTDSG
jgi:GntR family transcriptional regulator, transcriptional repressor for pyruvate dehydrogenase complex